MAMVPVSPGASGGQVAVVPDAGPTAAPKTYSHAPCPTVPSVIMPAGVSGVVTENGLYEFLAHCAAMNGNPAIQERKLKALSLKGANTTFAALGLPKCEELVCMIAAEAARVQGPLSETEEANIARAFVAKYIDFVVDGGASVKASDSTAQVSAKATSVTLVSKTNANLSEVPVNCTIRQIQDSLKRTAESSRSAGITNTLTVDIHFAPLGPAGHYVLLVLAAIAELTEHFVYTSIAGDADKQIYETNRGTGMPWPALYTRSTSKPETTASCPFGFRGPEGLDGTIRMRNYVIRQASAEASKPVLSKTRADLYAAMNTKVLQQAMIEGKNPMDAWRTFVRADLGPLNIEPQYQKDQTLAAFVAEKAYAVEVPEITMPASADKASKKTLCVPPNVLYDFRQTQRMGLIGVATFGLALKRVISKKGELGGPVFASRGFGIVDAAPTADCNRLASEMQDVAEDPTKFLASNGAMGLEAAMAMVDAASNRRAIAAPPANSASDQPPAAAATTTAPTAHTPATTEPTDAELTAMADAVAVAEAEAARAAAVARAAAEARTKAALAVPNPYKLAKEAAAKAKMEAVEAEAKAQKEGDLDDESGVQGEDQAAAVSDDESDHEITSTPMIPEPQERAHAAAKQPKSRKRVNSEDDAEDDDDDAKSEKSAHGGRSPVKAGRRNATAGKKKK